MSAARIVEALKANNVTIVVYLADTWLAGLLRLLEADGSVRMAAVAREEEGVAICCGAALARRRSVLAIQNSGLLSAGNTITTLAQNYALPILMLISYRGDARDPSFYHIPKGRVTERVLRAYSIPYAAASPGIEWDVQIHRAFQYAEALPGPYALLLGQEDLA
jgi:sulfopyruvate decarboxylase subunit alpha